MWSRLRPFCGTFCNRSARFQFSSRTCRKVRAKLRGEMGGFAEKLGWKKGRDSHCSDTHARRQSEIDTNHIHNHKSCLWQTTQSLGIRWSCWNLVLRQTVWKLYAEAKLRICQLFLLVQNWMPAGQARELSKGKLHFFLQQLCGASSSRELSNDPCVVLRTSFVLNSGRLVSGIS